MSCRLSSSSSTAHGLWILRFLSHTTPELQANAWPVYLARAVHARQITRRLAVSFPNRCRHAAQAAFSIRMSEGDPVLPSVPRRERANLLLGSCRDPRAKVNPIHALPGQIDAMHCAQKFWPSGGDWRRRGKPLLYPRSTARLGHAHAMAIPNAASDILQRLALCPPTAMACEL